MVAVTDASGCVCYLDGPVEPCRARRACRACLAAQRRRQPHAGAKAAPNAPVRTAWQQWTFEKHCLCVLLVEQEECNEKNRSAQLLWASVVLVLGAASSASKNKSPNLYRTGRCRILTSAARMERMRPNVFYCSVRSFFGSSSRATIASFCNAPAVSFVS